MIHKPLILIIDDEEAILKTLRDALVDEAYRVEILADGQRALDVIGKLIPDLIILDILMPNCNGLELLTQIKKEFPAQKVIIISGFGNIPTAIEAMKKGALDFIEKPLNLDEILLKISFLKEKSDSLSQTSNATCLEEYNIVGESNLFRELIHQTERLAPHRFPILIYGEPGTGKSTLAHYIHKKSLLAHHPCTVINCEVLSHEQAETIFQDTFASTLPQTIYIKHIDKLAYESQKALLLLLEQIKPKHRIIASSRTALFHLVQEKKFNESLFYHINKAPLEVPPLRKRPYDIPLLINHFIQRFNENFNKDITFSTASIRLLRNHPWPGNIHELQQAIQKIIVCGHQKNILPTHLASILGEKTIQFIEEQAVSRFNSLDEATQEFKKNFLLYLLQKNYYNITQVSQQLNLSPMQLKNKLLELKIDF